jgi:hypothetical protein
VPLSKEERKRLKAHRRAGLSGAALLDDFADEVDDIVGDGAGSTIDAVFRRHQASQKYGADLAAQVGWAGAAAARVARLLGAARRVQAAFAARRRRRRRPVLPSASLWLAVPACAVQTDKGLPACAGNSRVGRICPAMPRPCRN